MSIISSIFYYLAGVIAVFGSLGLAVLTLTLVMKPQILQSMVGKRFPRRVILLSGCFLVLATFLLSGVVMAATEPASVKQERIARERAVQAAANEQLAREAARKPVTVTKTETKTEPIRYTSSEIESADYPKGERRTTTTGVDGIRTYTYEVTYSDGKEQSRREVKSEITLQPVNEVVSVGSYVAPVVQQFSSATSNSSTPATTPATATVHAGAYCSPAGATAVFSSGNPAVCAIDSKGARLRWQSP